MTGRIDAAREIYEDALARLEKYERPDSAERGRVEQHLAEALGQSGRLGEAMIFATRARKRLEAAYGRGHFASATVATTFAELHRWNGDFDKETAEARAAVEALTVAVGPENSATAHARIQLARALLRSGAMEDAEAELTAAQAAIEPVNPEHPALVQLHIQWARLHARRGEVAPATLAARRAYALAQAPSSVPIDRAEAAHVLALLTALADPGDPSVEKFASEAEALYEEARPHPDADVEGAQALLRDPAAAARGAFGQTQRD
jgi:hypothetical protein